MNGYVVVDASIWVARLVAGDVFHEGCREWLEKQRSEGVTMLSPAFLLVEVAGAISRRASDPTLAKQAVSLLQQLPGVRLVALNRDLVGTGARLAADLGLRGADALYVAVAKRLQAPLATLDQEQKQRAASLIAVQEI